LALYLEFVFFNIIIKSGIIHRTSSSDIVNTRGKSVSVKIKLNLPLMRLAGNREIIEVTGSTVRECLNELVKQIPGSERHVFNADGSLTLLFLLNNEAIKQDLDQPVFENDELWLLSIVSGG